MLPNGPGTEGNAVACSTFLSLPTNYQFDKKPVKLLAQGKSFCAVLAPVF